MQVFYCELVKLRVTVRKYSAIKSFIVNHQFKYSEINNL